MEESAPKRRRTSPRTSVNVAGDEAIPESSTPRLRRKRPSFASPTKASLARHNPEILERRRSRSPQKKATALPSSRRQSDAGSEQSLSDLLTAQLESSIGNLASEGNLEEVIEETQSGPSRRMRHASGRLAAPAKRSPTRRTPPSIVPTMLPTGTSTTNDAFNPFAGRVLRRSPPAPVPAVAEPEAEADEPELPPSVPGAVTSTTPKGIHTSPSRWRYTAKDDSPLKQPPMKLPRKPNTAIGMAHGGVSGSRSSSVPSVEDVGAVIRRTRSFDPDFAKKRERDALKEEIDQLTRDLEVVRKENERIRLMQQTGRILAPSDPDGVLKILRRQTDPEGSTAKPTATSQLLGAALNPGALLPFGKPLVPMSSQAESLDKLPEIKSHHPVLMTVAEELPYLELFSPFTVSTKIAVLPPEPRRPTRQRHSIMLQSREVSGAFTGQVDMIVNATNLTILDLKVPSLEPAAKAELSPFIDKLCSGECNRSMQRNVGILCWAMGEWVRVASERANFWLELERSLATEDTVMETVKQIRAKKSKRRKGAEDDMEAAVTKEKSPLKRADLFRFMGQQFYDISIPGSSSLDLGPTMRLHWKVEFDWTGEARSKLAVMVGVPGKCEY